MSHERKLPGPGCNVERLQEHEHAVESDLFDLNRSGEERLPQDENRRVAEGSDDLDERHHSREDAFGVRQGEATQLLQ